MDHNKEVTFVIEGAEIQPQITMPSSATILQLKKKIAEKTRVPVDRQSLLYKNILLLDSNTINQYNFGTSSSAEIIALSVDLLFPDERVVIDITVSSPAFALELRVNKIHKVVQLKEKLAELFSLDTAGEITLRHMDTEMLDDKRLYKYFVTDGSDILFTRTASDD